MVAAADRDEQTVCKPDFVRGVGARAEFFGTCIHSSDIKMHNMSTQQQQPPRPSVRQSSELVAHLVLGPHALVDALHVEHVRHAGARKSTRLNSSY